MRCHFCNANKWTLMSELNDANGSFSPLNYNNFIDWLLYCNTFDGKKKRNISISTI